MDQLFIKIAEIAFMVYALRLVLRIFKRLFTRLGDPEAIDEQIDKSGNAIDDGVDKVIGYFKNKKRKRKEDEKPIVTIR